MLTPAMVVFDWFAKKPKGAVFLRDEIVRKLKAFRGSHIKGAILQLKRGGILKTKVLVHAKAGTA
jgi:hypothetical protein